MLQSDLVCFQDAKPFYKGGENYASGVFPRHLGNIWCHVQPFCPLYTQGPGKETLQRILG